MATTAEVDAAITKLRSARAKVVEVSVNRDRLVLARDAATAALSASNTLLATARADAATARTELVAILGQTET